MDAEKWCLLFKKHDFLKQNMCSINHSNYKVNSCIKDNYFKKNPLIKKSFVELLLFVRNDSQPSRYLAQSSGCRFQIGRKALYCRASALGNKLIGKTGQMGKHVLLKSDPLPHRGRGPQPYVTSI